MIQAQTTEVQTTDAAQNTGAALAPVSIKETVLAQFKQAENTITTLAAKYLNVAYDVATPKGMKEAVAARADLRDNGRLFVTKAESRVKTEVNDLKRIMADEVMRLVAIVKPVEDSIDAQIKAEETRKAEEKAKRDREEAKRIADHKANIEKIKGYVALAQGHSIETIDHAAETLFDMSFGPEWEEFATEAAAARDAAVESLNKLIASERQRLENERLQKELADARAALALVTAANEKAALEATAKVEAEKVVAEHEAEEAERAAEHKTEEDARIEALVMAAPITPLEHPQVVQQVPVAVRTAMAPAKPAPTPKQEPTITLEDINLRLAPLSVTAEGLAALGFETVNGCEYAEIEFTQICCALLEHIESVCEQAFA